YDNGDNLLFREDDLRAPADSALFRELEGLADPKAEALVGAVRKALDGPLDRVPLLDELLPELAPAPASSVKVTRSAGAAPPPPKTSPAAVTPAPAARSASAAPAPAEDAFAFDDADSPKS